MAALFFLTGAIALGNQVLWSRFAALIVPNTILTYTLTLTMVLVGLVIGSALATRLEPGRHHVRTFGALQVLTGVVVLAVAFLAPETWQALGDRTRMYLLLFLPASVLSGASFPLAVRIVTGDPTRVALDVGRLGAVNTLGGIVGSLAAAFLLPVVGLSTALHVTTALSVVAGCTTWMALDRRSPLMARWVLSGLAVGTWVAIARVSAVQLPRDFLGDPSTLVAVVEGAESNLAVSRSEGRLLLTSDGWWQGQDEKSNQIMAAHVPMLLHANPQSALVVGVGAGQTPARFMLYPIDRLDVVDIEPAVFDVVRDYFDAGWMRDPRVRLLAEDGRAVLRRGRETYDVVSIEVGQIMRPGVAAFYTRDAYVDARRRLAPGGIVGQFVPLSFLTPDTFRGIVRTFVDVFPQSVLWYNRSELLLIGFAADRVSIDPDRLALLDRNAAVREDLRFSLWGGAAERQNRPQVFLSGFLVGPDGLAAIGRGATVYSDDRPELDYAAAAVVPEDISHDPLIAEIRAHVEPLSAVLNTPMTDDRLAAVAALQQRNLDDLTAWSLARQAGFLDATDPGRGIRLLERAREANPDSVRVLTLLGTDYLRAGRTPEALTVLERGAAIDPNDSQVQRDLGFAFGQVGRWEEAISHLQIATGLQPNDAYAYYLLGVALQATGRAAEGEEHLRRALELWPGFQPAIEALR